MNTLGSIKSMVLLGIAKLLRVSLWQVQSLELRGYCTSGMLERMGSWRGDAEVRVDKRLGRMRRLERKMENL